MQPIQIRVCNVLRNWVDLFYSDFDERCRASFMLRTHVHIQIHMRAHARTRTQQLICGRRMVRMLHLFIRCRLVCETHHDIAKILREALMRKVPSLLVLPISCDLL
jgi:hypothetical protein